MNRELGVSDGQFRRDWEEKRYPACSQINEDGEPDPRLMYDNVIRIFVDTGDVVQTGDVLLGVQ